MLATQSFVVDAIINSTYYVPNGTSGWASTAAWAINSQNSYALNGQNEAFYLNRANQTGTQLSSTISDFASAVEALSGSGQYASTSGWSNYSAHSYLSDNSSLLNGQNSAYYLNRANLTGTDTVSVISDLATNGTAAWATNAGMLGSQTPSYYSGFILDSQSTTPVMSYKSNVDVKGPGQITMTNGTTTITGVGTTFTDATVGTGFSYWFEFYVKDSANNWYRVQVASVSNDTAAVMNSAYGRSDIRNGFQTINFTFPGVTGTYDYYTVRNWSDGLFSLALGNYSYADNYSLAFGGSTVAIGSGSTAIGYSTLSSGSQSFAIGNLVTATGNYAFAGGHGYGNGKLPLASGQTSFAFYEANISQVSGNGALAPNSAILGGLNGNVPVDSPRTVVLGGNAVKARAATPDYVYVSTLNIVNTPTAGTSGANLDFLLRYNSGATGDVAKLAMGSGFTVSGGTLSVSTSLAGTSGWSTNSANSYLLNNNNASFYLSRSNQTGTQTVATISDLATNGTSGWSSNSGLLGSQNGAYYLNRANLTGSDTVSVISDLATNGTAGWSTNSGLLGSLNSSYYLSRSNQTGSQTSSTISDFTSAVSTVITSVLGSSGTAGATVYTLLGPVTTTTTSISLGTSAGELVLCNTASNDITITLPTAVGNAGVYKNVKKKSSLHNLFVATVSSQTIDDSASNLQITSLNTNVTLTSDGANWQIT